MRLGTRENINAVDSFSYFSGRFPSYKAMCDNLRLADSCLRADVLKYRLMNFWESMYGNDATVIDHVNLQLFIFKIQRRICIQYVYCIYSYGFHNFRWFGNVIMIFYVTYGENAINVIQLISHPTYTYSCSCSDVRGHLSNNILSYICMLVIINQIRTNLIYRCIQVVQVSLSVNKFFI